MLAKKYGVLSHESLLGWLVYLTPKALPIYGPIYRNADLPRGMRRAVPICCILLKASYKVHKDENKGSLRSLATPPFLTSVPTLI